MSRESTPIHGMYLHIARENEKQIYTRACAYLINHHGRGGNQRWQDGSPHRHHHPRNDTECIATSMGKYIDYHPVSR